MLTLWAYARFAGKSAIHNLQSKLFYVLALLFFSLGLMSKPMLVTVPFVLLLLDFWPLCRIPDAKFKMQNFMPLLLEKIPFFVLAAVFSVITYFIQKNYGAVVEFKYFPLKERLANVMISYAGYSWAKYFGRTRWPCFIRIEIGRLPRLRFRTVLFIGLCLLAIAVARQRRYVDYFVGWFWFVGMLVPVMPAESLCRSAFRSPPDRYTYLPSIGIFIVLAWGLAEFAVLPARRTLVNASAILAVIVIVPVTIIQVHYWKNSETLFGHAVDVTGSNTEAHYILGALYESEGRTSEALPQFEQSVRDNPDNVKALGGLGYIYCCQGRFDEAAGVYQAAVRIEPDSAKAQFGLAEVYRKQHRNDEAMDQYFLALKLDPDLAEAHYQLAALYSAKHDDADAIFHLQETVRLAPDWFLALNNLAWILATGLRFQIKKRSRNLLARSDEVGGCRWSK